MTAAAINPGWLIPGTPVKVHAFLCNLCRITYICYIQQQQCHKCGYDHHTCLSSTSKASRKFGEIVWSVSSGSGDDGCGSGNDNNCRPNHQRRCCCIQLTTAMLQMLQSVPSLNGNMKHHHATSCRAEVSLHRHAVFFKIRCHHNHKARYLVSLNRYSFLRTARWFYKCKLFNSKSCQIPIGCFSIIYWKIIMFFHRVKLKKMNPSYI